MGELRTVFLAEDDEDSRDAMFIALTRSGYRVVTAGNGRGVLDALDAEPALPSLLILDWMMPVMGGAELLGELARQTRWDPIPVLVVSAVDRVVDAQVAAVLAKPVRMRTLIDVVDRLCGMVRGDGFLGTGRHTSFRAATPTPVAPRETAPTRIIRPSRG